MPRRAVLFASSIAAMGVGTASAALALWTCDSPPAFLLCLALAVMSSTLKVILPGFPGAISPNVVPILFAAGKLSWQETVIIACLAGITQCLWRAGQKPTSLQVVFNGASLSISAALAHTVSHEVTPASSLLLFATAAIVYQVVNTVSVATILSLLSGAPLRTMWRTIHFWSFPWSLVSGGVAAVWAQIDLPIGFSAAVLCGVTLYLMSAFCEEMVARTMRSSETQNSPALTAGTGRPVAEN